MIAPDDVSAALGLPAGADVPFEAIQPGVWRARPGVGSTQTVIVRRDPVDERAVVHLEVMKALGRAGFGQVPRLLGNAGLTSIEEDAPGLDALTVEPPPGSLEAAIGALAAFHALPLPGTAGHDSQEARLELLPEEETPLFRLGFSSVERSPALLPLKEARELARNSPVGPSLRFATAEHVLLAPEEAWLVDFGGTGPGLQYFDVAGFLTTSGADGGERRRLAQLYARLRGADEDATADLVDLSGILWGIDHELELPRRQILAMGDEGAMERLLLSSARVNRSFREAAGWLKQAMDIRAALWPS